MFIMPFVVVLLRITLWGKTSKHHLEQFFADAANSSKALVCLGKECPEGVHGVKPIVLKGTITEQHAKFLAILLQLKPDALLAVACPSPYQADVKAALANFSFKNVLIV